MSSTGGLWLNGDVISPTAMNIKTLGITTSAPAAPTTGQLWYDETNAVLKQWNGTIWTAAIGYHPYIIITPNGPTDGGDYGANTSGTTTLGFQEAINSIGAYGGEIVIMPNSAKYDLLTAQLIIPNDRPLKIKSYSVGYPANNATQTASSVMIRYGGTDWLLKTSGSSVSAYNNYFDIENIVFELYGGAYAGGLNFLNLAAQIKGEVTVVDYSASGSSRVTGSIGVIWDYASGTGSNGYELLNDHLFVKGFDTCVVINIDHFQISKMHILFGHTAQLQIGVTGYYPLNPTFGDLHLVAGNSNAVTSGISVPCTSSDSVETWVSNIYFEAVSGGSYTDHFNIQAPVRPNRGFVIGMLHSGAITTTGNYQHILALSRDGMANGQFGFGYSSPAVPSTAAFTNTNYYTVTIYQTGTQGGALTITDVMSNSVQITGFPASPHSFKLHPGESGQFAVSGPSTWRWYAEPSG